jgi:uncharacterized protein YegJ (DUF2314 family)
MKHALIALALAFTATPVLAQKPGAGNGLEDSVMGYADSDARMNAAIEHARALLPLFLQEFRGSNAPGAFTIKAGLATSDGGREHIWIGELRYEGEQLVGVLINEPYDLPGLRLGSRVEINPADISDWTIATPDGVYGGFTTRVMIEDMPPAQAEQYRTGLQMTPDPTPSWWVQ